MLVSLLCYSTSFFCNEFHRTTIPRYYSSNISLCGYKACQFLLLSLILSHYLAIDLFYLFDLSHKSIPPGLFIAFLPFPDLALFSSICSEALMSRIVSSPEWYREILPRFISFLWCIFKTPLCYTLFYLSLFMNILTWNGVLTTKAAK